MSVTDLSPESAPFAPLPQRRPTSANGDNPATTPGLPRRSPGTPEPGASGALPRRAPGGRPRRAGRHRSMHRISVASDAPTLVLAVPGTSQAAGDLADRIAESAADSCVGVDIRIGYLSGSTNRLVQVLAADTYRRMDDGLADGGRPSGSQAGNGQPGHGQPGHGKPGHGPPRYGHSGYGQSGNGQAGGEHAGRGRREQNGYDQIRPEHEPRAVVVPLLAGPHPAADAAIASAVRSARPPVMLAAALGPHPLLAGALHDRLSEAGLARASRARGLNFASGASGIIVVADRGPQAISDAGVTAVLLAARLAVPVLPASLGDPNSIGQAVWALREAGAARLAIAPCVIGPETNEAEFAALCAELGAPSSAPLGDHLAIAQLVAVRYGEALARISVASR